jgi:hypothetical protein
LWAELQALAVNAQIIGEDWQKSAIILDRVTRLEP